MKRYLPQLLLAIGVLLPFYSFSQTEVRGGLRLQLQAPVVHWLQLGQGASAMFWGSFPLSMNSNLSLSVGCQHFGGYQAGLIDIEEITSPFEYWRNTEMVQLNGLTFGFAELGYERKWLNKWSSTIGIRFSHLLRTEGFQGSQALYHSRKIRSSTSPRYPLDTELSGMEEINFIIQLDSEPISEDYLNTFDVGFSFSLEYQLTKGLAIECGYYQGLLNRWNPDNIELHPLRISSLYLGLSVRMF